MANHQRQPFTPRGPFSVGRAFTWEGKGYSTGDVFPHNRLAIGHRRLQQLWEQKRLNVEGDYLPEEEEVLAAEQLAADQAAADAEARRVAEEEAAQRQPEDETGGDGATGDDETPVAGEGEFLFDPQEHMIERDGKEYWVSDAEAMIVRVYADMAKILEEATQMTVIPADKIIEWPDAEEDD